MRFVNRPRRGNLRRLQRQMDQLLSEFMEHNQPVMQLSETRWYPAVDVYETAEEIVILAEVPGVERDKIDVVLHGELLHITGERQLPAVGCARRHQLELKTGIFERTVKLPCPVDGERVEAKVKDGILTVVCPNVRGSVIEVEFEESPVIEQIGEPC